MEFEAVSPSARLENRLRSFRGSNRYRPLDRSESLLLWILTFHLCLLPWALGAVQMQIQIASAGFALLEMVIALVPRDRSLCQRAGDRLAPWLKLRRFPVFWIGVLLLLLIAVQARNPAYRLVIGPNSWWVQRIAHVSWLPSGVEAPFGRFNPWREFMIVASVWMTTCAVWIGIMRRRSLRILLGALVGNGVALCALEAFQRVTGNFRAPWPLTKFTPYGLNASFVYKNHAGAYLALVTFAAIALATWHFDHGARRLMKSTPAGVFALMAVFIGGGVLFTLSKGASLLLAAALTAFGIWLVARCRALSRRMLGNPAVAMVVTAGLAVFSIYVIRSLDFSSIYSHFQSLAAQGANSNSVRSRILVHRADTDMLLKNWVRGVGAGGFRYIFPTYLHRYPEIYQGGLFYWEHAHGDWWEVPIELGLAGDLLLLVCAAWWASWFIRKSGMWNALVIPLLIGCAQTFLHAGIDFPFQSPAILTTWCVLLAVAAKAAGE